MDLLQPSNENLKIHEDLQRGIFVGNVREECVCSVQQAIDLLEQGEVHRHFGATGMNDKSSRSHTIFRLTIESREMMTEEELSQGQQGAVRIATLNLVDLAGSERVSHTKAEGVRLFEGGHINKSLLTLGTVISKLADGKRDVHIPYRDSKLTRILQTALGGNSRTAIICTVTPAPIHSEETHFTLKFANRAKNITNDAHINEILNDKVLIGRMKKETDEWKDKCRELEVYVEKLENEREKWAQEFCEQHDQKWKTHCQSLEVQIVKSVEAELDGRFSAELERRIQRIEEDYRRQELNMQEQLLQHQRRENEFEEQKRAQFQQKEQEWESQRQTMLVQQNMLQEQIQKLQTEVQQVEEEYQTRISELEQDKDQIMIDHSTTYEEITKLQAELQKQKKENMDLKIRYGRRIARDKETERTPLQKIDLNAQEIKSHIK
jgi:centromeric protein E